MNTALSAFGEQLIRAPDRLALVHDDEHVSYAELARRSLDVAHRLQGLGVGRGDTVALACQRSTDAIAAMYGVMLCSAAFVPIDPNFPDERIAYLLRDSSVVCVITDQALLERISRVPAAVDLPLLALSERGQTKTAGCPKDLASITDAWNARLPDVGDIAYVMYTSGSTGQPKGVPIPHAALNCYCSADIQIYELHSDDRTLQFSTLSFDICIEEIFPPLSMGSTVVLRPAHRSEHQIELSDIIERHDITAVHLATGYWHEWVDLMCAVETHVPASLRLMVVTGEKVSVKHYQRWLSLLSQPVLWANAYGPTETTVSATVFIPPKNWMGDALPIGRALPGYTAYVIDQKGRQVSDGETGELCIGGGALAVGYLNRPEQTRSAFIADPFSSDSDARLYRTGDLACVLPDGTIHYAGRTDHQIKLGSYRIEPGEIENAINNCDGVAESIVSVSSEGAACQLIAHVAITDNALDAADIGEQLRSVLPQWMLPGGYVLMQRLPKTINGKIDRAALPDRSHAQVFRKHAVTAATNETERKLCVIWQDVLGLKQVGIHDSFLSMGGDSLMAVRVIAHIQQELDYSVSTRDFFFMDTVALLSAHMHGQSLKRQVPAPQTGFINTRHRQLYTVMQVPQPEHNNGQGILLVPPLGNEQRRVNRPFRGIMQHWSRLGYTVLRFDWTGTGNSSGEAESLLQLEPWLDDLRDAADLLAGQVDRFDLVAVRMGALLAAHASLDGFPISQRVYWEPVISGQDWLEEMTQLHTGILSDYFRFLKARRRTTASGSIEEMAGLRLHRQLSLSLADLSLVDALQQSTNRGARLLLQESTTAARMSLAHTLPDVKLVMLGDNNDWADPRATTLDMLIAEGIRYLSEHVFVNSNDSDSASSEALTQPVAI